MAYVCKDCKKTRDRSQDRGRRGTCQTCGNNRVLCTDTQCNGCLKKSGLKKCHKCHEVKVAEMDFTIDDKRCDYCMSSVTNCHICGCPNEKVVCPRCNTGLDAFKRNPQLLYAACKFVLGVAGED